MRIMQPHSFRSAVGLTLLGLTALLLSTCSSTIDSTDGTGSSTPASSNTESQPSSSTRIVGKIDPFSPTAGEVAVADAFVRFADSPSAETAAALPFAGEVSLGLASDIITIVARSEIADASRWQLDVDEYAGFGGPFSALDHPASSVELTVGPHDHCANPPIAPPSGFEDLRQISLQPTDIDSCIDWWSVDFYLDEEGQIRAVTLLLFGP
jgi:hypothetical protein